MIIRQVRSIAIVTAALLVIACDNVGSSDASVAVPSDSQEKLSTSDIKSAKLVPADELSKVTELRWDDLVPKDWNIQTLINEYNTSDISDDDPRAEELMQKIQESLKMAPVVEEYDGKQVKIPGFIVPLEMDANSIREFLLVPYFGACVHSPPPPANQTVYIVAEEDKAYQGELFDTVWVTGTMKIERVSSKMGDSGYRIDASSIEPYDE